jgi:hypothetical protein
LQRGAKWEAGTIGVSTQNHKVRDTYRSLSLSLSLSPKREALDGRRHGG